jgi:hypothetical protein
MVRHRHVAAVVAIAAGLALSLAPIASADPAPLAQAEAEIAAGQDNVPVRSNPDEQTGTLAAAQQGPCSEVCSGGPANRGAVTETSLSPQLSIPALLYSGAGAASTSGGSPQAVVRAVASHGGFNWGDAGIGAGAVLILLGIGLAVTLVATNGHRSRTRKHRAVVAS